MDNWKLESWSDYWKLFDHLCLALTKNKKEEIASELRSTQKYVTGLSDGWYEPLEHFQTTIDNNMKMLDHGEKTLADFLIKSLKESLNKR